MRPTPIRPARVDDLPALAALNAEVQALHFAHRPDQFKPAQESDIAPWLERLLASASTKIWVFEQGGVVLGYVIVLVRERPDNPFCPARTWWEIDQIGVRAAHRGTGVGQALIEGVAATAAEHGIAELELCSWAFNESAHRAFERAGFVPKVIRFERRTR